MQMNKNSHQAATETVRGVIHQWDPYGLLALGCPDDEFDAEIKAVVRALGRIRSVQDAVHVLSRVFSASFEPKRFRPEDCQTAGEQLYQALLKRRLV